MSCQDAVHTGHAVRQSTHLASRIQRGVPTTKYTWASIPQHRVRCRRLHAKGSDDAEDEDRLEKLLWRELQKRGISSPEQIQESKPKSRLRPDPAPQFRQEQMRSQLEESRKLNSEGLEGLIPRGKQLASLGGTFFLAFWPFLLVLSALFSGIFWLSGEKFIHGGRPSYTKYIEPAELLSEPTVDERIPFR